MNSAKQMLMRLLAIAGGSAALCLCASLHAATGTHTYDYDPLNLLTNASYSDGSREAYAYDSAGNRRTRVTHSPTVHSDTVPPSCPSNLAAQVIAPTQYHLAWSRSFDTGGSGFAGYSLFVNGIIYTNTTATNQLVSDLSPGSNYTFTVAAYDRATNTSLFSSPVTVTVSSPPSVTVNPTNQTALVGDAVSFSVTATGNPSPSYQWWKDGALFPSATSAVLTLSAITTNSAGGYSVVITNAAGSVTSSVASLTVNRRIPTLVWPTPPTITYGSLLSAGQLNASVADAPGTLLYTPPLGTLLNAGTQLISVAFTPSDSSVYLPASGSVSLSVSKSPLTVTAQNQSRLYGQTNPPFTLSYRGFVNGEGTNVLSALPSATTTATITSPPGGYPIQVSGGVATNYAITFTTGILTVTAEAPVFTTQPQPATVTLGNPAVFTVTVDGVPGPSLNWFKDGTQLTNSFGISGATATTLTIDVTGTNQAGNYFATATNIVGSSTSSVVTLTVLLPPAITAHPTNVLLLRTNLANVLPATFSVAATGTAPLLYQWRFNGSDLPGATNQVFNLTNVTRLDNGLYSVLVTNTVGTTTSSNALLRVRVPQRLALPERLSDGRLRLGFIDDLGDLPTAYDAPFIEVQFATNLLATNIVWSRLTNAVTVTNGRLVVDEPPGVVGSHRFYRVIER